jgi:hypothetical protein
MAVYRTKSWTQEEGRRQEDRVGKATGLVVHRIYSKISCLASAAGKMGGSQIQVNVNILKYLQ